MQTLMYFYVCSGLLLAALSLPLMRRKIKPNGLYGFRNKATMENPEVWYKVNHYSGQRLFIAGIGIALTAVLCYVWPGLSMTVDGYAFAVTGVGGGLLLWAILSSYLYLKSLG